VYEYLSAGMNKSLTNPVTSSGVGRGGEGPAPSWKSAHQTPELKTMPAEHYITRGWDENGIPTPEKLKDPE
jgi:aldehyde:ferredoxin oxidoreductase